MTARVVHLASQSDVAGWRDAARAALADGLEPSCVSWRVAGADGDLFGADDSADATSPPPASMRITAPRAFLDLARSALLHCDPERFNLLYRILWRLRDEPRLLDLASDVDVARAAGLAKAVRRDEHKMHAFVRFREVQDEDGARFVAWFEPTHHIVEASAPFFARRFASMRWSILTPERSAHWDGATLTFTPGAVRADAPLGDPLEETWRRYYASIFNPARLKIDAMRAEMPVKYWRNLPEAMLIKPLIAEAARRSADMVASSPTQPLAHPQRLEQPVAKPFLRSSGASDALDVVRNEAAHCRACPLWKPATQTVFGEGPSRAALMFVGEQAGDQEDLAGRPFIGPAGKLFDRALDEAGIERKKAYVTNAVKHFKFLPRGKKRIHQRPAAGEISACRPWLDQEIDLVDPQLVVALGAVALQGLLRKAVPVNANRGRILSLPTGRRLVATVHPSYLLRLPDEDARQREYARFVDDLRRVASELESLSAAA